MFKFEMTYFGIAITNWLMFVLSRFYLAYNIGIPPIVLTACFLMMCVSIAIMLLSTIMLIGSSRYRILYTCLALLYFLLWPLNIWSANQHLRTNRDWFMETGVHEYMNKVDVIKSVPGALSGATKDLSRLFSTVSPVCGHTNKDGSMTIFFGGRDNSLRAGYIYHSGSLLATNPWALHKDDYFYHLTNEWYEY